MTTKKEEKKPKKKPKTRSYRPRTRALQAGRRGQGALQMTTTGRLKCPTLKSICSQCGRQYRCKWPCGPGHAWMAHCLRNGAYPGQKKRLTPRKAQ